MGLLIFAAAALNLYTVATVKICSVVHLSSNSFDPHHIPGIISLYLTIQILTFSHISILSNCHVFHLPLRGVHSLSSSFTTRILIYHNYIYFFLYFILLLRDTKRTCKLTVSHQLRLAGLLLYYPDGVCLFLLSATDIVYFSA